MKKESLKSVLIFVLLLTSCLLLGLLLRPEKAQIAAYGTYCSGAQTSPDSLYFTLEKNGAYLLYRQFEPLDQGTAQRQETENNVVLLTLRSDNTGEIFQAVYCGESMVVLYGFQGEEQRSFARLSELPSYVNVPHPQAPESS